LLTFSNVNKDKNVLQLNLQGLCKTSLYTPSCFLQDWMILLHAWVIIVDTKNLHAEILNN